MDSASRLQRAIQRSDASRPAGIPPAYIGLATLPGTGRVVYWTGKVAVGLRYENPARADIGQHAERIQAALLGKARRSARRFGVLAMPAL